MSFARVLIVGQDHFEARARPSLEEVRFGSTEDALDEVEQKGD
jgi:hypothetical protein